MEDQLLIKYIRHTCSLEEARAVLRWIEKSEEHKNYFKELQVAWVLMEIASSERTPKRSYHKRLVFYSLAFSAAVAATLFWMLWLPDRNQPYHDYDSLLGTLELQKEIVLVVDKKQPIKLQDSSAIISYSRQGQILINDTVKVEEVEGTGLNTIYVPYGKRSRLILSDGTLVHLNSGSSLIYPSVFEKDRREVYLDGEAYFEVKPENSKREFVVQTAYKAVEVLGTRFNVLADKEEGLFETVLVTGKIALEGQAGRVLLTPNEYYGYSPSTREETIKSVDVSNYISWIDGKLKFNKKPLSKILRKLEKVYDVKVISLTTEYDDYLISGSLDLKNKADETLDIVMRILTPGGENKQFYKLTDR